MDELNETQKKKKKLKEREPTGFKRGRENDKDEEEEDDENDGDLKKLKVSELREKCKELGLPTTGKKDDLIDRIKNKK